ncbi:MAG: hypothetical protein ABIL05_05350 [candidate division WOR-3 bacterium]
MGRRSRLVGTGTDKDTFFAYAKEFSLTNSMRFIWLLLGHLEFFGVDTSKVIIQTNNGAEFICMVYTQKDRGFTEWSNLEHPNMTFKKAPWQMVQMSCGIDNPNFINFPPLVLDDNDIDVQWMLSARDRFLAEYAKLMPFVYCRSTKGELSEYHVSDGLSSPGSDL